MRNRTLVLIVTTMVLLTSAYVAMPTEPTSADATTDISEDYRITFKGLIRYESQQVPEDHFPSVRVIIAHNSGGHGDEWVSVEESVVTVNAPDDATYFSDFAVQSKMVLTNTELYGYFVLVEEGYEISQVSKKIESVYTIIQHNKTSSPATSTPYKAYRVLETIVPSDEAMEIELTENEADCIGVISATGSLVVTVRYGGYDLSNAEVLVMRDGETNMEKYVRKGYTKGDGVCTISDVPTGNYNIVVNLENYNQNRDASVEVKKGDVLPIFIEMTLTAEENKYFGFDLPHFLMIIGGTIGAILVVLSVTLQRRIIRSRNDDILYDDVED